MMPVPSSTSNSRGLKRIILVILFVICFFACNSVLRYILLDDASSYSRVMMHQMYNAPQNIDILFVGSSHTCRSIDPSVTDEAFGTYTFNGGSINQFMDGSNYIIREVAAHNDLKTVYLEVYYGIARVSDFKGRSYLTPVYAISDYMKPSLRKIRYILDASSEEYWVNGFCAGRRNWAQLFNPGYIAGVLKEKNTDNYRKYKLPSSEGQEHYVDRGFLTADEVFDSFVNYEAYGEIDVDDMIGGDWEKSLLSIIDYCKKEGIELVLFTAPEPEQTIIGKGNYQEYYDYVKSIASEYDVEYDDFNLCSYEYFDTADRSLFGDIDHLNSVGAMKFSQLFGQLYTGEIKREDMFFDTLAEKTGNSEPTAYCAAGPHDDDDNNEEDYYVVSNRADGILYSITAVPAEGGSYSIQEFSENNEFSVPQDEDGTVKIEWMAEDGIGEVHSFEFQY